MHKTGSGLQTGGEWGKAVSTSPSWARDCVWRDLCSNPWVVKSGRVQCPGPVTYEGMVRNLGLCVLKFDSPLPEDL